MNKKKKIFSIVVAALTCMITITAMSFFTPPAEQTTQDYFPDMNTNTEQVSFIVPILGEYSIVQRFVDYQVFDNEYLVWREHKAYTMQAPNSIIVAPQDGITKTEYSSFWGGKVLTIEHANGIKTVYKYANIDLVQNGEQVSKGQHIGYINELLRLEVLENEMEIDPTQIMPQLKGVAL